MEWWMYVLIAAGLVVVFDLLLLLWLGIATREPTAERGPASRDAEY